MADKGCKLAIINRILLREELKKTVVLFEEVDAISCNGACWHSADHAAASLLTSRAVLDHVQA